MQTSPLTFTNTQDVSTQIGSPMMFIRVIVLPPNVLYTTRSETTVSLTLAKGLANEILLCALVPVPTSLRQTAGSSPKCQGPKWVSKVARKLTSFSPQKMIQGHLGCQNGWFQPFLSLFGLVMACHECHKAFKMGRFGTKKWGKNGSKTHFSKTES